MVWLIQIRIFLFNFHVCYVSVLTKTRIKLQHLIRLLRCIVLRRSTATTIKRKRMMTNVTNFCFSDDLCKVCKASINILSLWLLPACDNHNVFEVTFWNSPFMVTALICEEWICKL